MRKPDFFISALLATALILPQIAEARGGFGGRVPRMNFGGGGFRGGGFHASGFNGPSHFQPQYHSGGGGMHPPHGPAPHPSGHYPPNGGGHPHPPGPGPGPHPPVPGPHPPGPPPGPHGWGPPHLLGRTIPDTGGQPLPGAQPRRQRLPLARSSPRCHRSAPMSS
jgi:hypothetical protein